MAQAVNKHAYFNSKVTNVLFPLAVVLKSDSGVCGGAFLRALRYQMCCVFRLLLTSSVFSSLNLTFRSFAHSLIISVLISGLARPNDILVSSANNLITDSIVWTVSLMKIKNGKGPSSDPWGTPEGIPFSADASP